MKSGLTRLQKKEALGDLMKKTGEDIIQFITKSLQTRRRDFEPKE